MASDSTPKSYSADPDLYLYTSLTAGSSHIVSATSRLETILKANKVPFKALDVATDEKARMLWGRRAGGRKLPGLVRAGMVIGDLEEIDDWNEYGELKENLGIAPPPAPAPVVPPPAAATPSKPPATAATASTPAATTEKSISFEDAKPVSSITSATATKPKEEDTPQSQAKTLTNVMAQIGAEAAKKAGESKSKITAAAIRGPKAVTSPTVAAATTTSDVDKSLDHSAAVPPPSGKVDETVDAAKAKEVVSGEAEGSKETPAEVEKEETVHDKAVEKESPVDESEEKETVDDKAKEKASEDSKAAEKDAASEPLTEDAHPSEDTPTPAPPSVPTISHEPVEAHPPLIASTTDPLTTPKKQPDASTARSPLGSPGPASPAIGSITTQHRGSEISLASAEEIKEVERDQAIAEESEGEEGATKVASKGEAGAVAPGKVDEPAPGHAGVEADEKAAAKPETAVAAEDEEAPQAAVAGEKKAGEPAGEKGGSPAAEGEEKVGAPVERSIAPPSTNPEEGSFTAGSKPVAASAAAAKIPAPAVSVVERSIAPPLTGAEETSFTAGAKPVSATPAAVIPTPAASVEEKSVPPPPTHTEEGSLTAGAKPVSATPTAKIPAPVVAAQEEAEPAIAAGESHAVVTPDKETQTQTKTQTPTQAQPAAEGELATKSVED